MTKDRHSRREFLSLTGAGMAGIAGGTIAWRCGTVDAQATNFDTRTPTGGLQRQGLHGR